MAPAASAAPPRIISVAARLIARRRRLVVAATVRAAFPMGLRRNGGQLDLWYIWASNAGVFLSSSASAFCIFIYSPSFYHHLSKLSTFTTYELVVSTMHSIQLY